MRSALILAALFCPLATTPAAAVGQPFGPFILDAQSAQVPCIPPHAPELRRASAAGAPGTSAATYPLNDWPMANALHDALVLVNYVDLDGSGLVVDYTGSDHSYDGHNGTDITLLNFRDMDRGIAVLAGAAGTVTSTEFTKTDRNIGAPFPDNGNFVILDTGSDSGCLYWHFRTNSVAVNPGENVAQGQMLGMAGSSGFSTDAHLHFETGEWTPSWVPRDPWNGTQNPQPSLWNTQLPYVGSDPLRVVDLGVTTEQAAGGNLNNIPITYYKDRMSEPAVFGDGEPWIAMWFQLQGQSTDSYVVELRRPDGTLFANAGTTLGFKYRYGWHYWFWSWAGQVVPSQYGTWTVRVLVGGLPVAEHAFEVGAATEFAPRFFPLAGRSMRVNGSIQYDTLRVSPLGAPATYTIPNPPPFVSLIADSIVCFDATSSQPYRSHYVEVVATDASGRRDTMSYHMVDPSKPVNPLVSVIAPGSSGPRPRLSAARPNPFTAGTTLRFWLPSAAHVRVDIVDVTGKRVRRLIDAAHQPSATGHLVQWNGRDAGGMPAPAGLYYVCLRAGDASVSRRVVRLN